MVMDTGMQPRAPPSSMSTTTPSATVWAAAAAAANPAVAVPVAVGVAAAALANASNATGVAAAEASLLPPTVRENRKIESNEKMTPAATSTGVPSIGAELAKMAMDNTTNTTTANTTANPVAEALMKGSGSPNDALATAALGSLG